MLRTCIKCGVEQDIEQFLKEKTKDGRGHRCRTCIKKYQAEYQLKNKECLNEYSRNQYYSNKQPYLERSRKQREANPEAVRKYQKQYQKENRERLNRFRLNKLHTDVHYKLRYSLRNKFRKLINGYNKTNSALVYLGCTVEFLKGYLEAKFTEEMTWENYGNVWHIDHVLPCRSFDLTTEEGKHKCFHYTNLQPLLALDNLKKLDRLPNGNYARHENRLTNNRS